MLTRGYIDGIFGAAVRGWVVDLDDPASVLHVVVHFDGRELGAVAADEPRPDLAKAGIGAGSGGFRVHLGNPPAPGAHEIVAVVAGTSATIPLARDVRLLDGADAPRADVELYEGRDAPPPSGTPRAGAASAAVEQAPPPAAEPALAGEAGWLFACRTEDFGLLRGVSTPDGGALDELVARIERLQAAAAERDATCLVAVVPDKLHVYPERAPATMELYPAGRVAEHLAARVQDADDVLMLDLLATLLRARVHGRVFSRAGTGPTWLGAFHAYRAVAKSLSAARPALRPRPVDALRLGADVAVADAPGDGRLLRWQGTGLVPDGVSASLVATAVEPSLHPGFGRRLDDVPALVVHDAPSARVAGLLADHCAGAPVEADAPDARLLDGRDADVVVWLVSDGSLARLAHGPA